MELLGGFRFFLSKCRVRLLETEIALLKFSEIQSLRRDCFGCGWRTPELIVAIFLEL